MENRDKYRICSTIVTYFPAKEVIDQVIYSLIDQVDFIVVVDNTPDYNSCLENIYGKFLEKIELLPLRKNVGLAKAVNIGILKCLKYGADFIILSDQDTIYPHNYTESMLVAFNKIKNKIGENVAAIGPIIFDINKGKEMNVIIREFVDDNIGIADFIILSGMFIPTRIIKEIGFMKEEFFIDWMDTEWCWRADVKGYKSFLNFDIMIKHSIGDFSKKVFCKSLTVRQPKRHYYIVRNATYMILYANYINIRRKLFLLSQVIKYTAFIPMFIKPRFKRFYYSIRGLWDGFRKNVI